MNVRTRLLWTPLLAVAIGLLYSSTVQAADWDRFPDRRSNVGIKKRFDGPKYTDFRRCLRGLDSRVDAEYYSALVDITAEDGSRSREANDARPYADALFQEWSLDEDEDILIVLGIRNRSLGVRPGEKWKKLGLDKRTIDETVDASDFEKFRRRGDYGEAVCSLATALDYRLAALEQSMKRRIERIGSRLPDLADEREALGERVERHFDQGHPYGDELREKLELAATFIADAEATAEEDPAKAVSLADNAFEAMQDVRSRLKTYQDNTGELEDISAAITALKRQIESREDLDAEGPQEALSMLEGCREQLTQSRETLEPAPSSIRVCLADVKTRLARADVHHEYQSEVIPTAITAALIALAIAIIVLLFLRRRRTMAWIRPELEEWTRQLEDMQARLGALVERFPHYFEPREPWTGESEQLDHEIRSRTALASLLAERGQVLARQARELSKSPIPLAILGPERALKLLRETTVSFEQGDRPSTSPVDLALPGEHQTKTSQLLGEMFQSYADGLRLLEQAADQLDEVATRLDDVGALQVEIDDAVRTRESLGLPLLDIQGELDELTTEVDQVRSRVRRDPIAALDGLRSLKSRLETLRDDLQAANDAYESVSGPLKERGDALRGRVRELKRKGEGLDEPGFSPAAELDATARVAERIRALAREGRGRVAQEKARELSEDLDALAELIDVNEEAPDLIPVAIDAIKEQRDALKSDILKLRVAIGRASDEDGESRGFMARVSDLQASLSDRGLHLNRVQRALHKGHILTAAADTTRAAAHVERGKSLTARIADELDVEPDGLQSPGLAWPEAWRQSQLSSWRNNRFGSSGSKDLPW